MLYIISIDVLYYIIYICMPSQVCCCCWPGLFHTASCSLINQFRVLAWDGHGRAAIDGSANTQTRFIFSPVHQKKKIKKIKQKTIKNSRSPWPVSNKVKVSSAAAGVRLSLYYIDLEYFNLIRKIHSDVSRALLCPAASGGGGGGGEK